MDIQLLNHCIEKKSKEAKLLKVIIWSYRILAAIPLFILIMCGLYILLTLSLGYKNVQDIMSISWKVFLGMSATFIIPFLVFSLSKRDFISLTNIKSSGMLFRRDIFYIRIRFIFGALVFVIFPITIFEIFTSIFGIDIDKDVLRIIAYSLLVIPAVIYIVANHKTWKLCNNMSKFLKNIKK